MNNQSQINKLVKGDKINFTQVSNDLITDNRLTSDAKILLIKLLSHSDNWTLNLQVEYKSIGFSNHKGAKASKNLEEFGYLVKNIIQVAGKIKGWNITVFSNPKVAKLAKSTEMLKCSITALRHNNNTNNNNTESVNNINISSKNKNKLDNNNKVIKSIDPSRDVSIDEYEIGVPRYLEDGSYNPEWLSSYKEKQYNAINNQG